VKRVLVTPGVLRNIKKRTLLNAKRVASPFVGNKLLTNMPKYILERNLINAVIAEGVLELYIPSEYINDNIQARSLVNARCVANALQLYRL